MAIILFLGLAAPTIALNSPRGSIVLPENSYTGSRIDFLNIVPQPETVCQTGHQKILDEFNDLETLPSLRNTWSVVSLSVNTTNQELNNRLACAFKRYSRSHSDDSKARLAFAEIILVHEQINHIIFYASRLYDCYCAIRASYYSHNSTTIMDLKSIRLDNRKAFLISAQPLFLKWAGFDYKEMYWDP